MNGYGGTSGSPDGGAGGEGFAPINDTPGSIGTQPAGGGGYGFPGGSGAQGLIVITYYPITNNGTDQLTQDNIDQPYGTGLGASTTPDASKTILFSPSSAGTYTFYAMAQTGYYSSWAAYASTTITVTAAPTCTPVTTYSCTGAGKSVITQTSTSTSCAVTVTNLATCTSPQYCQAGSSSCLAPAIYFNQSGNFNGNLQLVPDLLQSGETTQVHWSVADAQSCTVTGTNGDSWSGLSSPTNGDTSKAITGQVTYTLSCTAYGSNPNVSETEAVNLTPVFEEK